MPDQKPKIDSDGESSSPKKIGVQFLSGIVKTTLKAMPATIIAAVVGLIGGGFLGLAFGPVAPLIAITGCLVLGLPVAIWEYKIKKRGGSAWEFIE
jgi:hypothetical protein